MTSYRYRDSKPLGAPGTSIHLIKSAMLALQCAQPPWAGRHACNDIALVHCRLELCVLGKRSNR